jgi:hypothetical protein
MRVYVLIALIGSFLGAIAIHMYDCRTGTYEQCLISRGMFWAYWLALFLAIWMFAALIGSAIKSAKNEPGQDG